MAVTVNSVAFRLRTGLAAIVERVVVAAAEDPEFARWLKEEYSPLAGGWHY